MDPKEIGKFISDKRKEKNMSQSELANILSVTSQAVSKWENGRGIPDIEMLKRLSEVFQVNIDEILSGKEKKVSKNNKRKIIYLGLLVFIVVLIGIIFLLIKPEEFQFSSLATDNDFFTIKGVMAYSKNKKSIYISEVNYDGIDEDKYKAIECILLESEEKQDKIISRVGNLKDEKTEAYPLTELLKGIEFNVNNYECGCTEDVCRNLYLRINAKLENNKIITYQIPIQLEGACEG